MLCLGARVVASGLAALIAEGWLNASYEGDRHQRRLDMITRIEQRNAVPPAITAPGEEAGSQVKVQPPDAESEAGAALPYEGTQPL